MSLVTRLQAEPLRIHDQKQETVLFVVGTVYHLVIYRVSRGECASLRENVPYVKVHRYNPKHLYPKLNGYGDNGERILKV